MNISGHGAVLVNQNNTSVGNAFVMGNLGTGTLTVADSGTLTINAANDGTFGGLNVGYAGSNTSTVTQTGGTIIVKDNHIIAGFNASAQGIINVSGGTLKTTGTLAGGNRKIHLGWGTVNDKGTLNISGTGNVIVNESSVSGNNAVIVGNVGQGTLNVSGGGSLTINNVADASFAGLSVGTSTGSGAVNVSGGSVNVNSNGDALGAVAIGIGSINVSGGSLNVNSGGTYAGIVVGTGTTSAATVNLNGGTIATNAVIRSGGGASTFNFNGGTLRANFSSEVFLSGLTTANVRNGGAVLDTNGNTIVVGQAFSHSNVGGDSAVDGGLVKVGTGTLMLTGASTYTGGTTVSAGTLRLGGATSFDTTNATVQLDASQLSAGALTTWTNLITSPAGNFVGNGTVVAGGTAFNGLNVMHFTGAATQVFTNNLTYPNETVLYVGAVDGTANNKRLVGGAGTNNWLMGFWGGNQDTAFDGAFIGPSGASATGTREYSLTHSSGSAVSFFKNGALLGTGTGAALNTISLGGSYNPPENSAGSIGELLVFNSVLSDAARTQVESYLQRKWFGGLTTNILPTGTAVTVASSGAVLDVNGVNQTIGALNGVVGSSVTLGGGALVTGNSAAAGTYDGVISGAGSLTQSGSGTTTLTGANTYTGSTTVTAARSSRATRPARHRQQWCRQRRRRHPRRHRHHRRQHLRQRHPQPRRADHRRHAECGEHHLRFRLDDGRQRLEQWGRRARHDRRRRHLARIPLDLRCPLHHPGGRLGPHDPARGRRPHRHVRECRRRHPDPRERPLLHRPLHADRRDPDRRRRPLSGHHQSELRDAHRRHVRQFHDHRDRHPDADDLDRRLRDPARHVVR